MKAPVQTRQKSKLWLRSVPVASGAATIAIAFLGLAALLIGLNDRAAALPLGLAASAGAVAELFLCGGALLLLHGRTVDPRKQHLGRALAATACALAVANVVSIAISENGLWMLPMPPGAAANFLLTGVALLTIDVEWRRQRPAQMLGCVVGVIALLSLLEHFFGATVTSDRPGILRDAMSVPGALGCIFLAVGILCKYPDRGLMRVVTSATANGMLARRLLMAAVAIPATLAWLELWGERAGLFDAALGAAMLVASNIVLFLLVIWKNAEALQRSDLSRLEAEAALRLSRDDLERQIIKRTAQLRQSEELQRTALNALPQHLVVIDKDGVILETNQAWHRYIRDAAPAGAATARVGSRYVDAFSEFAGRGSEAALKTSDGIPRLLKGEIDSFSFEYPADSSGGQLWFLLTAIPLGRESGGAIVAHTDITVRRRSEEESHTMAEMLRSLQAVTDSALSQLSFDSLIPEILMRVGEAVHADSASLLLMTEDHRFLSLRASVGAGEDDDRDVLVPVGEGVAGHIAATQQPMLVDDLKTTVVFSPGLRSGFASLIGVPLIGADRLIGVIHAQSRRPTHFSKEDLRLMLLAAERIAVAIERAQRYEAEQQSRIRAEEASRMKDEFLAVVSHELRSPLNTILGWVTLLRGGNLRKEAAERALETIERSARAQNRIVSDLLDVSKIITGKLSINVRPVEMAGIIEAAVESVRPAAEAKSIRLQLALDLSAGPVSVDPDRIQQVVWNLVSNAIRFTPADGRIQVRLERVNTHIEITVKDDGCGIKPEFLPFVFDRFSQADSSSTRKMLGLGLGLAIVRHLVELHGGVVDAESDGEGLGSTFVIKLPLVLMRQTGNLEGRGRTSENPDGLPSPPPIDGLKVLVVDENADARDLVSEILVNCDADVSTAATAQEALAMLAEPGWQPEVIITDIEAPESEGYQLIREIRARESDGALRQIPAIALMAFARSEDRMRALGAGYQMHLSKPVEPAELVTVVASLAGRIGA